MRVELDQNTTEWLEFRKNRIGASDASVIMGASPWKTPLELWKEKIGLQEESYTSMAMQAGKDLEEIARPIVSNVLNCDFKPAVYVHDEYNWMMASLDGIDPTGKVAIEIKKANKIDHEGTKEGKIPKKYYPQLQTQMEVQHLDRIFYCSFLSEDDYTITPVERDDDYIFSLKEKLKDFHECMVNFIAPKLSEKDFVSMEGEDNWKHECEKWLLATKQIKEFEAIEKEARKNLIKMAGQSNCKGHGLKVTKVLTKGRIDYEKAVEGLSIDLERHRKPPIESWRFSND